MKVVKKNVYYCDFCKKKSLISLKKHERHCTGNPDRHCQLCGRSEGIREIGDRYKAKFETHMDDLEAQHVEWKEKFTLADLENELDYACPNCMLALIRYIGLNRYYFKGEFKYDYKKELDGWWARANEKAREVDGWDTY